MEAKTFTPEPVAPPADNGAVPDAEWLVDKGGKQYVAKATGRGKIFRQGDETVAQARERDAIPVEERRPRRKPAKPPPKPRATAKADLQQLEKLLAEALKTPGVIAAGPPFFDEWAGEHFAGSGPYLARTIVNASEYNPWLRRKLEEAATGEDMAMKVIGMIGITGALFMYLVPPTIYFLNMRVPDKTRDMFGIPPRREPEMPVYPEPEYEPAADQADQAGQGTFSPA